MLFVTAGDPSIDELPAILRTLEQGGADAIEIGIPYSDPIADGPTIQASSQRALDSGIKFGQILESVKAAKVQVPLVAMGYTNSFYSMGFSKSAELLRDAGFSGTILCDVTPEEAGDWISASKQVGLDTIFLAAPTSGEERLRAIAQSTTGFLYALSRTGVTGAEQSIPKQAHELVAKLRELTDMPICLGFGISTPEQVSQVCQTADGAVIGSSLVNWLYENWRGGAGSDALLDKVRTWKAACSARI